MKTAVLVSGMCRQFDIAVKSWKFLNDLDCDVYFSTWKKSVQSSKVLNMHVEEDITENTILEHIPNAKIKIYDVNDFDFPGDKFYHNDKHLFLMKSSSCFSVTSFAPAHIPASVGESICFLTSSFFVS